MSSVCMLDREHGSVQLGAIEREHSECLHQTGGLTKDDRLGSVILVNHFNPLMSGWGEQLGDRQPGS